MVTCAYPTPFHQKYTTGYLRISRAKYVHGTYPLMHQETKYMQENDEIIQIFDDLTFILFTQIHQLLEYIKDAAI